MAKSKSLTRSTVKGVNRQPDRQPKHIIGGGTEIETNGK